MPSFFARRGDPRRRAVARRGGRASPGRWRSVSAVRTTLRNLPRQSQRTHADARRVESDAAELHCRFSRPRHDEGARLGPHRRRTHGSRRISDRPPDRRRDANGGEMRPRPPAAFARRAHIQRLGRERRKLASPAGPRPHRRRSAAARAQVGVRRARRDHDVRAADCRGGPHFHRRSERPCLRARHAHRLLFLGLSGEHGRKDRDYGCARRRPDGRLVRRPPCACL
jgi:hypothetical protein